ncbi:uncharacterized protein LOC118421731 [Branchiostoma floridae]|uniref:Uncharacterized protein LOC118421731 n=1 Tax=Branchiostoma floridae TaxID=7739 RepID=A0A9J7LLK6_BRAFL|nr:uncharacterized protein LOC118421731 [Branchiostoma floridae]
MWRAVYCTLLVLCVFAAGTAGFELADMIARLQRQNGELTETVANLTAALEASGPDRVQELETENSVLKAEKARLQREISSLQERIQDIELMFQTLQRRAAGNVLSLDIIEDTELRYRIENSCTRHYSRERQVMFYLWTL